MIYIIAILSGIINGIFSTGGGQILLFYLIFISHLDTVKSRSTAISVMLFLSIASLIVYIFNNKEIRIEFNIIFVILAGIIGGFIGQFWLKKINTKILNLISSIFIVIISVKQLFWRS